MYIRTEKKWIPSRRIAYPFPFESHDDGGSNGKVDCADTRATPDSPLVRSTESAVFSSPELLFFKSGPDDAATSLDQLPCSFAEEFDRASAIASHSRQVITQLFDDVRLGKTIETENIANLVGDITGSIARNRSALTSILRLKTKDEYTYMHSVAVAALMINLGRELALGDATIHELGMAGLLHDLGKMAMPSQVLGKPDALTSEEYAIMQTHPERGAELLKCGSAIPDMVLDVCLHHHEKIDGTGYPRQLAGDEISLFAKMGAVCDVYDAMTSNRPYKAPWSATETLSKMFSWEGHFDRTILTAFIKSIGIYPVGTLVRLKSERLAVVTDVNSAKLTQPLVRAFMSTVGRRILSPQDINLQDTGDMIVRAEKPMSWGLRNWEAEWRNIACLNI